MKTAASTFCWHRRCPADYSGNFISTLKLPAITGKAWFIDRTGKFRRIRTMPPERWTADVLQQPETVGASCSVTGKAA